MASGPPPIVENLKNPPVYLAVVRARIVQDNTGSSIGLPVLVTRMGLLQPLLKYQLLFHRRSPSWHRKLCFAVRLLLEYAAAHVGVFAKEKELFQSFGVKLLSGTFDESGLDPSGLYWMPRSATSARKIIGQLTELSQWLAEEYGAPELAPMRDATNHEQVLAAAAWAHRNNASFLGHAESRAKAMQEMRRTPYLPKPRPPNLLHHDVVRFPADRFGDLLFNGFLRTKRAAREPTGVGLRDGLITIMMHGAGLRTSECLHLWIADVQAHPLDRTRAWVRVGHPTHGRTKWLEGGEEVEGTRAEFLVTCGLTARNLVTGKDHAGWKDPALDGKWYLELHWSEPQYGQLFLHLWKLYLKQIVPVKRSHPYAWLALGGNNPGASYTLGDFRKAHARAVRRIGLVPRRVDGTTPHGHRHDYGQRLADAGVPPTVLRKCMHHSSLTSQLIYTQPDKDRINRELEAARGRMAAGARLDVDQLRQKYARDLASFEAWDL